jgi:hypothetical protein
VQTYLEDLGMDGKITLVLILNNRGRRELDYVAQNAAFANTVMNLRIT